MTVQEWIDNLMKVEDKSLPVMAYDSRSGVLEREVSCYGHIQEIDARDADVDLPIGVKFVCVHLG